MKLEDQLKNTFDHFEPEVDPSVWAKVSARLASPVTDGGTSLSSGILKTIVAKLTPFAGWIAGASAIVGLGIIWKINSKEIVSPIKSDNIQQSTVPVNDNKTDIQPEVKSNNQAVNDQISDGTTATASPKGSLGTDHQEKNAQQVSSVALHVQDEPAQNLATTSPTGNDKKAATTSTHSPTTNNTIPVDNSTGNVKEQGVSQNATNKPALSEETLIEPVLIVNTRGGFAPLSITALTNQNGKKADFNFGDGTQINNIASASHHYDEPGIYTVKCLISGRELDITVEVLGSLPSVFSPNGDGVNDQFVIGGTDVNSVDVHIYDRSGRMMLSGKGKQIIWDGSVSGGRLAETGTYFYDIFATSTSGNTYKQKGTINLFR